MMFKTQIVSLTDKGKVRTNNEDGFCFSTNPLKADSWFFSNSNHTILSPKHPVLLAVADGMGGMDKGEVASSLAIQTIKNFFIEKDDIKLEKTSDVDNLFKSLFEKANQNVVNYSKNHKLNIGTTLTTALVHNEKVFVYWLGDSRCYLFRKGKLSLMTKDHSYVQRLVDEGKITYDEAFYHPQKNIITQYIGNPIKEAIPDSINFDIEEGDIILLCTDGLNNMLLDDEIETIFYGKENIETIGTSLIGMANRKGGFDNITVILAAFGDYKKYIPALKFSNTEIINKTLKEELKKKLENHF